MTHCNAMIHVAQRVVISLTNLRASLAILPKSNWTSPYAGHGTQNSLPTMMTLASCTSRTDAQPTGLSVDALILLVIVCSISASLQRTNSATSMLPSVVIRLCGNTFTYITSNCFQENRKAAFGSGLISVGGGFR